jgi:cellulose synthase/poly-beta-1,6-N-acetylglucosamine synthase-like glycosyltransferase
MFRVDVTWVGYFMAMVSIYYVVLFLLSSRALARAVPKSGLRPLIAIIVPAHNEQAVIEGTLQSLVRLDYDPYLVIVVNDGSTDETGVVARSFETTGRVVVVDRPPELAGQGKGAALNEGYRVLGKLVEERDPLVHGFDPDEIVVGVVDADGHLEPAGLDQVARFFADPRVGGVQMAVIIGNAAEGLVERCQDLEFVGFTHLAQAARDRIGSVGLGGNGQFTRLVALRSLGRAPWTDCLTEDLDLGLHLARLGWQIRFCRTTSVTQQGVGTVPAWIRQRTRWAQGHYQCWGHIPRLLAARNLRFVTRLDLTVYLLFVAFIMFVAANLALGIAGAVGWITVTNEFLGFLPSGPPRNVVMEIVGLSPVVILLTRYQEHSPNRLRWWELPAYAAAFALYAYLWAIASLIAWTRLMRGRGDWAKTGRVAREAAAR